MLVIVDNDQQDAPLLIYNQVFVWKYVRSNFVLRSRKRTQINNQVAKLVLFHDIFVGFFQMF